jgi:hypothetical protein
MRHMMNVNWFDVHRDDEGDQCLRFPAAAYMVAKSQPQRQTS